MFFDCWFFFGFWYDFHCFSWVLNSKSVFHLAHLNAESPDDLNLADGVDFDNCRLQTIAHT